MDQAPSRRSLQSPSKGTNRWAFLSETARDFSAVGAIAPSSPSLARALVSPLWSSTGPLRVLEVGAGTGAVTRALLDRLTSADRLDIVEANQRFADRLRHLIALRSPTQGPTTALTASPISEFTTTSRYDLVVSGLPFANFTPGDVTTILDQYLRDLLRPGGTLVYFSYLGTRRARTALGSRSEALRHRQVEDVLAGYQGRYGVGARTVWMNVPPARVWELRRPPHPTGAPANTGLG